MSLVTEESEEKDKVLVQGLLDFKGRMDALVVDAFAGNETFSQALRAGLEMAINSRDNKPAELIGASLQLRSTVSIAHTLQAVVGYAFGCCAMLPILATLR